MANVIPKFKGVDVKLGDDVYVMPPLPVRAFSKGDASKKIQKMLTEVRGGDGETAAFAMFSQESISDLVSLVTTALQRNYPAITEEQVEDGIEDVQVLFGLFNSLITQNDAVTKQMEIARKNAMTAFVTEHQMKPKKN